MAERKPLADFFPSNRREFAILLAGIALALGISSIPGLTVEPQELTQLRTDFAVLTSERTSCAEALADCGAKITGLLIETGSREAACIEELARLKSTEPP